MKFRRYGDPIDIFTNPGSPLTDDYEYKYNDDGTKDLVIAGHTNLFEKIQAEKDYCDIGKMVARFAMGDEEALNRVKGFYGDMTEMPKNYAEMIQRVDECRRSFDALDPDIKKKFDNNSDVFWSMFGTAEFNERLGNKAEKVVAEVEQKAEVANE